MDYQQASGPLSPLQHFWSLAVEEQFYLLWPALVIIGTVAFAHRHPRTVRPILSVLAVGGIALSLWTSVRLTHESAPVAYFMPQTRAWEFGVGALVAVGGRSFANLPTVFRWSFSLSGLAILIAAATMFDDPTPYPGTAAITPVAATALIIASGVADQRVGAGRLLALRPMQTIGRCSYGWYLWHWPVLVLAPSIFGFELDLVERLEMCLIAFALAVVTLRGARASAGQPSAAGGRLAAAGRVRVGVGNCRVRTGDRHAADGDDRSLHGQPAQARQRERGPGTGRDDRVVVNQVGVAERPHARRCSPPPTTSR